MSKLAFAGRDRDTSVLCNSEPRIDLGGVHQAGGIDWVLGRRFSLFAGHAEADDEYSRPLEETAA